MTCRDSNASLHKREAIPGRYLDEQYLVIWLHKLLPAFHHLLRSHVFHWAALNSIRIKILYRDCVTLLQTRIVLFTEHLTICGLRLFPGGFGTELHHELADITIRIFSLKNIVPASWLACVWPLGPFRENKELS